EQLGMRELVNAKAAARSACALGKIEDEILRPDAAIHEMMLGAAQPLIKTLGVRLRRALHDFDLHEPIADEQRRRHGGLDRLLVSPADDDPIDDRVHLPHFRLVELDLRRDVDRLAVDDEAAYPFLPQLGEDEIELLAVDLERR